LLALAALLYSSMRFIEAYGLWRIRAWAEWFAIVSGGVYLPVELYELIQRATAVKAVVLIVNIAIVGYLIYFRWSGRLRHAKQACRNPNEPGTIGPSQAAEK
jgi:uncharacterized membrane protein (DUF2068 family)